MQQSTDTHRTIKELSPAELAAYRERLDAHFRNRQIDEAFSRKSREKLMAIFHATRRGIRPSFGRCQKCEENGLRCFHKKPAKSSANF